MKPSPPSRSSTRHRSSRGMIGVVRVGCYWAAVFALTATGVGCGSESSTGSSISRPDTAQTTAVSESTTDSPSSTTTVTTLQVTSSPCPSEPPFVATTLPDGFSANLLPGSGGQITIGPDGTAVPIEPVDPAVHHYSGGPGQFIDIYTQTMPGYAPAIVEQIEVLGTSGEFGGIEDGFKIEFSLPCCTYTMLAYGVSSDEFKAVVTGLVMK